MTVYRVIYMTVFISFKYSFLLAMESYIFHMFCRRRIFSFWRIFRPPQVPSIVWLFCWRVTVNATNIVWLLLTLCAVVVNDRKESLVTQERTMDLARMANRYRRQLVTPTTSTGDTDWQHREWAGRWSNGPRERNQLRLTTVSRSGGGWGDFCPDRTEVQSEHHLG